MKWLRDLRIELVWNPFSHAERGREAELSGRIGDALRSYARCYAQALRDSVSASVDHPADPRLFLCLRTAIPNWPIRQVLEALAHELIVLEVAAEQCRTWNIVPGHIDRFIQTATDAQEALWQTADRIARTAAVTTSMQPSARLQEELAREEAQLRPHIDIIRENQEYLALWVAKVDRRPDIDQLMSELQALTQGLRDVLDDAATRR